MQHHLHNKSDIKEVMCRVLRSEARTVESLADQIHANVLQSVEALFRCEGRVVVTGMGKMSAIARKMVATLCSTGTPAIFLHPSEAVHGDLGIVTAKDLLLALSNSGETNEVIQLVPFMKRHNVPIISITGSNDNSLAQLSTHNISLFFKGEADEVTAAPTNSTTATLAMCDAIAIALVHLRGFTADQFAIFHPGGNLGRKLLLSVADLMHTESRIPLVPQHSTLRDAIVVISQKTLGAGFVVDSTHNLLGILTDGDLRRILEQNENPLSLNIDELMTRDPLRVSPHMLAAEALQLMEENSITVLPVVENESDARQTVVGALHLHDLLQAGLA